MGITGKGKVEKRNISDFPTKLPYAFCTSLQRVDGCYGPLVVRVPEASNPQISEYDYDLSLHTMILIDWERITGMEKFLYHHHSVGDNKPATLLINGMGNGKEFVSENKTIYTPLARFPVEQGYRYRFRVINAGFPNYPIKMSVDNHTILVISSDGADIVPVRGKKPGESQVEGSRINIRQGESQVEVSGINIRHVNPK
ncbi:unnamed protein product [Ceutorhynchus assimilis]|uniref:Plastocyanin-like domain-containing protein n=1 Tax=Ceutorhynchus assimilis TaxID=467358 RepID=A0A9N9N2M7_9CUCU|nr:unnamed protein product [Ceutorhynchus assimilis]